MHGYRGLPESGHWHFAPDYSHVGYNLTSWIEGLDMALSASEINELKGAKALLEHPGLAAKVSSYVGAPIETLLKKLYNTQKQVCS